MSLKPSARPLDGTDIAALAAVFGSGSTAGLTRAEKAAQEAKLRPYMRGTPEYRARMAAQEKAPRR